jgi:uncharacterized protein (DUF302 family)
MDQTKFEIILQGDFDKIELKVRDILRENGFGIITEIDVTNAIKIKLNKQFKQYKILGACNPEFAYEALTANDDVGLLLPCNVVILETPQGFKITSMKPTHMLSILGNKDVCGVADKVDIAMEKVFAKLSE